MGRSFVTEESIGGQHSVFGQARHALPLTRDTWCRYPSVPLLTDLPDHMQWEYCRAFDDPDPEPSLAFGVLGRALDALHKTLMALIPTNTAQRL